MSERLPVAVLTGALGSGKTTLLARLLAHRDMGETAVLVNELGEVGIDHHLLRQVDERTVLLASGCLCCTMRGDLADELRDLLSRRDRGEVPPFGRVVIETAGLADPAPILYTPLSEPVVRHHFELEAVVATVDAVHGLGRPEAIKQVAAADTLVVTKTDVAEPGAVAELERRLARLNPGAALLEASFGDVEPALLFDDRSRDPRNLLDAVAFGAEALSSDNDNHSHLDNTTAFHDVQAFVLLLEEELDWTAFGIWLTMLLASRGQDVLRVKGFLNVGGQGPLLLNGVQHVVHPPLHLDAWPDEDRRSRIIVIAQGVEQEALEASLAAFNRAARS